ncbi:MAG: exodeoxyribonuclease VII small subunit [Bacteroidota bacterium]
MKNRKEQTISFEDQLARLEEIVQTLDDGTAPLEELLKMYEEGMKLTEDCRTYLEGAEQRITEIKKSSSVFKRDLSETDEDFEDEEEVIDDEEIDEEPVTNRGFKKGFSNDDDIGLPF